MINRTERTLLSKKIRAQQMEKKMRTATVEFDAQFPNEIFACDSRPSPNYDTLNIFNFGKL